MSRLLLPLMAALLAPACRMSGPFEGPGYEDGVLVTDAEGPFLAVTTYARHTKGEGQAFQAHVDAIEEQLRQSEGLVGYRLRGEIPGREVWTITVWEDEEAMLDFVISDAHAAAMLDADDVIEVFSSAHYEVGEDELPPGWDRALEALDGAGEPRRY